MEGRLLSATAGLVGLVTARKVEAEAELAAVDAAYVSMLAQV